MNYYIKEIENEKDIISTRTARGKAREDAEEIFERLGLNAISIPSYMQERNSAGKLSKVMWHVRIMNIWKEHLNILKQGDLLVIQFPIDGHSVFQANLIGKLAKRGVKVVLLIHDLESLRATNRNDVSFFAKMRFKMEEISILEKCSKMIAHNSKMIEYLESIGIKNDSILNLEIFDYLLDGFEQDKANQRKLSKNGPLIIAGNLSKGKAKYVYELPDNYDYNLYGIKYDGVVDNRILYLGAYPPNELPYVLNGNFGLVWDGTSSKSCEGVYGEYLRSNNPHKASLYLASGIPIAIWKEAALADFVKKYKCGILIESLYDIPELIENMTDEEYLELRTNAEKIGVKIREGYFLKKALNNEL